MKGDNKAAFFRFMNERHRIYLHYKARDPWPWTDDTILQTYKFTNVYRDLDAVSLDVRKQILDYYRPWKKTYAERLVRDVIVYRLFNWPATWQRLHPLLDNWDEQRAVRRLMKAQERGEKIFTGAYVCGNNGLTRSKIDLYCEAVSEALPRVGRIVRAIRADRRIENATRVIEENVPLAGMFVAYEMASDLRWSPLLCKASDIMTWANPGPGAMRGLKRALADDPYRYKVGDDTVTYTRPMTGEAVQEMQKLLRESQDPGVLGKHMRPLEMRDIEHSLCEFDKYMRVKNGEGRPRSKYKPPAWALRPARHRSGGGASHTYSVAP